MEYIVAPSAAYVAWWAATRQPYARVDYIPQFCEMEWFSLFRSFFGISCVSEKPIPRFRMERNRILQKDGFFKSSSVFLCPWMVWFSLLQNGSERNSEHFFLPRNGSERIYKVPSVFLFYEMVRNRFLSFFIFREIARNVIASIDLRNNFFSENCNPTL